MAPISTFCIEKSPLKENLSFDVPYIGNDMKMEVLFSEILEEVKLNGTETERTIILCQTRNQCALLWKMFELNLGDKFYSDADQKPTARIIEMYHAGSPDLVKAHVLCEIRKQISCLRILNVTVAFGMGID